MVQVARSVVGFDRAKLVGVVDPIVRAHGAELVDVELKTERGAWILRIYVEKLGSSDNRLSTQQAAVDLELCSNVARDLSPALDVVDVVAHAYNLEVSSPGVERTLRGEQDFVRFAGEKAKFRLNGSAKAGGASGERVLIGKLGPVENGSLTVIEGARHHSIRISTIESARLVFEFGPAPKPGKSSKKKKSH